MWRTMNLVAAALLVLGCALAWGQQAETGERGLGRPRIGVYDARAVAVAYAASDLHRRVLEAKFQELKVAEEKGDAERVAKLKAWGKLEQERGHLQAFAAADVGSILEKVEEGMNQVAEKAQVDAVVRKGTYVSKRSEVVDVTDEVVKLFGEPSERTKKILEDLKKRKPLSRQEVEEAEKKGRI